MKRFSKNDNQAICNYCGQWRPTDLTNQQLEEMDWKCDQCKAKEGTPEVEPTEQDRGSKEISKYDPEYEFLVKLVKLLIKEGVSPQEIKSIADSYPFETVDDVGDLTAKIWTLATEKYKIPREWLIKRLPKNASLKTAKQYFGTNVLTNPNVGQILNALKRSEFNGLRYLIDNQGNTYVWDASAAVHEDMGQALGLADFDGENIPEGIYTVNGGYIETPADAEEIVNSRGKVTAARWNGQEKADDMINHAPGYLAYQYGQDKESKKQSMSLIKAIEILNTREPKVISVNSKDSTITLADGSILSFDEAANKAIELSKTSEFTGAEFSKNDVGVNPTMDIGPFSSPADHGAKPQKQPFPNTGWLPADDENKDQQPYSNVASSVKRPFSKKATLDSRYWIAPDGQEFDAGTHHGAWVNQHPDILKQYGIKKTQNLSDAYAQMFASGWSRATNERGFTIQVPDLRHIPAYLDDFIAKHYTKGDVIRIGTDTEMQEISDPFPSIQRAVNKALRQAQASLQEEADLSGRTVNQILNLLQTNGGATFNLSQGNMVGTNNYAVAAYPDRAEILPGTDFDKIEEYLLKNEDLLNNPENSFGAWTHNGQVYLDVVATIPDVHKAIELGRQHNQIAIWDLKNGKEISTGGTGEVKQAKQNPLLPQQLQDEIAAVTSPAYNIALNNYAEAVKRGHEKDRSLEYAIESVSNLEQINAKKLVELINKYL